MAQYNSERYFWIKLTDRFLTSDTVDFLMEQKDGANYVVLYQMLCLKTINNDGVLARQLGEILVPFNAEKIQRETKWFTIDTVRIAMDLYKKLGLIYEQENGMLKISNFEKLIGSQTISAQKKEIQLKNKGGKGGGIFSTPKVEYFPPDKDKDKEKDKDKDKDKDIEVSKQASNLKKEITNNACACVREKKFKTDDYDDIFTDFKTSEAVKEKVCKFIGYLKSSFGISMQNERLERLLVRLDSHCGSDTDRIAMIDEAMTNGYKRLECEQ